ncbi:MAG: hypothetical protein E7Z86_10665 [Methanosphaera stadtmanae]|nr:hypothetical protein [Methanosphaera stadtmanae]
MQFILYHNQKEISDEKINEVKSIFDKTTSILCDHINYEWISEDKRTLFIGRNPNIIAYEKYNVFDTKDNNLTFIHGWTKRVNEDKLLEAKEIKDQEDELDGLYLIGKLDKNGKGTIRQSLENPPIYYAKKDDEYCLSSRIFTISKIFDYTKINKKHVASHIELQNLEVTNETIYENIYFIEFGSTITISDTLEIENNPDFLYDERLNKLYSEDKEKYWDECYEKVKSQVKAFKEIGFTEQLNIGITGGMDSRLLLSLYHEHVKEAFTSGPLYSPEVMIGRMICEKLSITHKTPATKQTIQSENLLKRMSIHIYDRQFEMSPWDLGRIFPDPMNGIRLDGHEYLKQDAYTDKLSIEEVLERTKKDLNHNYIIKKEYLDKIIEDDREVERKYIETAKDIRKYPKIRKVLNRGRWFCSAHETEFNHRFNILPLASDTLVKYNYNGSIESINNLECHVELIKRSNPELLDIPLFNNQFKTHPIPPIENKIPGKLNYKNIYLVKYYDHIIKYIKDNYDLISDIVKESFIEELTIENLENNSVLSQKVYNLIGAIVLFKIEDSYKYREELDVNFDVEEEENIDTTDEDILKALIEYNKDIVNLKDKRKNIVNNTDNEKLIKNLYRNKYELEEKNEELYAVINEKNKQIKKMKENNKGYTLNNYDKTDKDELINKLYKNKYELEEKNEELYQVINEKNKQLKEIDKYNYEDKDIISTLIMENEEIKKENKSLKEKNKQLQDYKEEMINSRSWKITKPLRNISQKVSKKN